MSAFKELKAKVEELTKEVERLKNIVITDELKKLQIKEKQLEEQNELLSNVRFRVKSAKLVDDDSGTPKINIIYQLPIISFSIDEEGNPNEKIPFFYSVNALGLIGQEDYEKINNVLLEAKYWANDKKNKK